MANLLTAESTTEPWYGSIPQAGPQATGGSLIGLLPSWKGSTVVTATDTLHMHLCSLHTVYLPKLPSMDLQSVFSIIMVFHIELLQIKELIS